MYILKQKYFVKYSIQNERPRSGIKIKGDVPIQTHNLFPEYSLGPAMKMITEKLRSNHGALS
jgi:hypothetical protein